MDKVERAMLDTSTVLLEVRSVVESSARVPSVVVAGRSEDGSSVRMQHSVSACHYA